MTAAGVSFRRMQPADLTIALGWAADEGWNPGEDDAAAFLAADPEGFFIAEVDGQPVASISVVNHGGDFAFLGLYICRPDFRGQGIGFGLWQHALRHAGQRCVGLDGVPAQQDNYRASGFVGTGRTLRFEGLLAGERDPALRPVRAADIPALTALEAEATGYAKPRFNAHWLTDTATRRTWVLDVGGSPAGFATVRRCRRGAKIGPLVARDLDAATRLLRHCAAEAAPGPVAVDVPDSMAALSDWCAAEGLTVSFETARMYRGPAPVPGRLVHTVSTLELG